MDKTEIKERLNGVFRDIFDDPELSVSEETTSADIEDWDSIENDNLIGAIEDEFAMRFKMREVTGMTNVEERLNII